MTINIFVLKGELNGENRSGAFLFLSGIVLLRIFLNITFLRFLKFMSRVCKNCCMHFILSEQDSPNRIEPDSSIL